MLVERALAIETALGPGRPSIARDVSNLTVLEDLGRLEGARRGCERALRPSIQHYLRTPRTAARCRFAVAGAYRSASQARWAAVCG